MLAIDRVRMVGDRVAAVAAETQSSRRGGRAPGRGRVRGVAAASRSTTRSTATRRSSTRTSTRYRFLGAKRPRDAAPERARLQPDPEERDRRAASTRSSTARTTSSSTRFPPPASSRASSSRARAWSGSTSTTACASSARTSRRPRCASSWPPRWTLPESQIVIDATFIGGDFGGKGLSIDEYTCYFLARATGRPIKAVMTYVDEMQASNSRHAAIIKLRTAVVEGREVSGAPVGGRSSTAAPTPPARSARRWWSRRTTRSSAYHVPVTRLEVSARSTPTASPAARCARRAIRSRCSRARATST